MTTNNILKAIHGAVKAGLGLAVCFGIAALFGACKNTVSGGCSCPNRTTHQNSTQPCCVESDYTCIVRKAHTMSNGMPLVIENRTKNDVSIYATAIHDSIQNVITTDSLPGQMPILQSRGLKIIIEYTGANIYANNTRTIDRTTAAIPYEFLSSISEPNPRDNSDFNNAIAYSMYNTSQIAMQKFLSPEDTQRRLVLFLPNGRISA